MKFKINEPMKNAKKFIVENKKSVILIIACFTFFFLVDYLKEEGFSGKYVTDEEGRLIGIMRENEEEAISVPIEYELKGEEDIKEETVLDISGKKKETIEDEKEKSSKEIIEDEIKDLIYNLENSTEKIINLPRELEEGREITWHKPRKKMNFGILIMIPILIFFLYENEISINKKKSQEKIKQIKKSIPDFNNQLLLLLNSGLIFSDAFNRIATEYKRRNPGDKEPFEKSICDIYDRAYSTNTSLVTLLDEYSKEIEVREFSRIASIICDNQYKGTKLSEKLEAESTALWEERKKFAEEEGKLAETKLTFPLALLLLTLILITAAPAILQI